MLRSEKCMLKMIEHPRLAYDVARCTGAGSGAEGWREGCENCLRRIVPGRAERQAMIAPPVLVVFECENLIEG
jgi:hypothetical protein